MKIEEKDLPKGWEVRKLGEVGKCITGNTPSKNDPQNYGDYIPFVKPPQLQDNEISTANEGLSKKGIEFARVLPINSVLVTCIGNLGRTAINKVPVASNQQINSIIPKKEVIDGKFLFYQAQSTNFKNQLEDLSSATTVAIVNKSKFENINIVAPPLQEQQEIVAKIEELFSELEKGKEELLTAQIKLKSYRQSLLKSAFEGRLTNENLKDGELPKGWEVRKLGEVCKKVETVKRKEKDHEEEFFYLDIGGIDNNANKILNHKVYRWKDAPSRAQQIVFVGDVLFSTVRTYMKNIALVKNKRFHGQIASSGFCVIRANEKIVNSEYIFYYSLSQKFLQPLNELQTGSSYPAVRDKDVFLQLIPLPKIEEQKSIVEILESKLTICDQLEETINASLKQVETLRQGILKKAFEGKLINKKNVT